MVTRWEESHSGTRNELEGQGSTTIFHIDGQTVDLTELYNRTQNLNSQGIMTTIDGLSTSFRTGNDRWLVTGRAGDDFEVGIWIAENLRGAFLADSTTKNIIAVEVVMANTFSDLDVIGYSGGTFVNADPANDIPAIGLALKTEASKFYLATSGIWQVTSHGKSVGENFVSNATPGAMTTTRPVMGEKVQLIAFVIDANTFIINPAGPMLP